MSDSAIYLRMSKAKRNHDGPTETLEAQRDTVHEFLIGRGIDPAGITEYSDILSAYKVRSAARPGWAALEVAVRNGQVKTIYVRHIDRAYRHTADLDTLADLVEKTGVKIETAWSGVVDLNTAAGRVTARILATVAQGEIETMTERVRAKQSANRAKGRPNGSMRAFGYADDGSIVEAEAALIRAGCADVIGERTLTGIMRDWVASGVQPVRGGQWRVTTVRNILTRGRIAGRIEHLGQDIGSAPWDEIVKVETLAAVRAIIRQPSRHTGGARRGPVASSLMTGLALCGVCGEPMKSSTQGRGTEPRVPVYTCCTSIVRDLLDNQVAAAMTRFYMRSDVTDLAPSEGDRAEYVRLQGLRGQLEEERADIVALQKSGVLRPAEASDILGGITDRQNAVDGDTEALSRRFALASALASPIVGKKVDIDAVAAIRTRFVGQHLDLRRRQVEQVWTVTVRPRHYASGLGLSEADKQSARLRFDCRVGDALSYDNLTELTTIDD